MPGARAPPRHATSLSACLPSPLLVWMPRRRQAATPTSLALSLALLLSPCSLPRTPERHHRRRSPLPRPPASPRPPPEPRSSASSSASSSTSQVTRDALHRRHRRLFHRRPPWIPIAAPPSPVRPRARFDARCNRGELRHRSPLSPGRARPLAVVSTMVEPSPPPSSPSTQLR